MDTKNTNPISIPTYNGQDTIERLLNSIFNQLNDNRVEILISDNKSTDATSTKIYYWCR